MDTVISTAYLPPIEYFQLLVKYKTVNIDIYENYCKQTYRNRCYIYAANGKLALTIPVIKTYGNHTQTKDIKIDYALPWQHIHWFSIVSAYNSSPFFLYYQDYFEPLYQKKYIYLIDFNNELLNLLLKLCGINCEIKYTEKYTELYEEYADFRNSISPKNKFVNTQNFPQYIQVFCTKYGFIPNLSIIDLLFNEGKMAEIYLTPNRQKDE